MKLLKFKINCTYAAYFVLLLAAVYELSMLGAHRMYCDEALYCNWAMQVVSGNDILLHKTITDKFPLVSYIISVFFLIFGNNDVVARIPGMLASVGALYFMYRIAAKMYGNLTGVIALVLAALCRYYLAFGATAFTDPYLTFFIMLSLWLLMMKKFFQAGLFLGIALMAKLTGVFFLPFYILAVFLEERENFKKNAIAFCKGFGIIFGAVVLWSALVQLNAFKLFTNNSPVNCGNLINIDSLKNGVEVLLALHNGSIGWGKSLISIFGAGMLIIVAGKKANKYDILLLVIVVAFYANLALMASRCMSLYDRYMVVIMPFLFVAAARVISAVYNEVKVKFLNIFTAVILCAVCLIPVNPKVDFGSYYKAYDGYEQIVNYFASKKEAVLFGVEENYWNLSYYFYDLKGYHNVDFKKLSDAADYIAKNEGDKVYLMIRTEAVNPIEFEKRMANIKGTYFDYSIKRTFDVIVDGKIKYVIYESTPAGGLKLEYLEKNGVIGEKHNNSVVFDNGAVELIGAEIEKTARNTADMRLHWAVDAKPSRDWRIFVHFKDKNGRMLFGADHYPAHGIMRFFNATPGDSIIDIESAEDSRMQNVKSVEVGLYNEKDGIRADVKGYNQFTLK